MKNIKKKKWRITASLEKKSCIENICDDLKISKVLATLLVNRGYTSSSEAKAFLSKSQEILHNPFLLVDMEKAVNRILRAVYNKEKITVFGDYDVDGVTSVSILYLFLEKIGATVDYYIPSRKGEGYGVSTKAIKDLADKNTKLIITVDTGITAIKETEYAKELGVDVVITDHHECSDDIPLAEAVINPKRRDSEYPFQSLAGVGVVFKLLCAIESQLNNLSIIDATRKIAYEYADLTAIGTIADVMPVIDENRIIIALGLLQAENTSKIGLASLINLCRNGEGKSASKTKQTKKLSSGFVGFTLAPRINAAGRIASASTAVELFLSKDKIKAERLALELCEINKERQLTENKIAEDAYEYIESGNYADSSILVLDNNSWHHGVIGIVASRISDRYGLPSILISFEGSGDENDGEAIGKGSGRSISGMNLVEALNSCSDLLEKFGGHELAAGLSIKRKNLPEFKRRMEKFAKECFDGAEPEQILSIDCEIKPEQATLALAGEIACLEPYGVSNPSPVFVMRNMLISDISPVGMNRHLRLTLTKDSKSFTSMLFSTSPEEFPLMIDDEVDVAFNLEINDFMGNLSVQISIKDIRPSERFIHFEQVNEELYLSVRNGESTLDPSYIIPTREDFALVYNFLLSSARMGREGYRIARLLNDITKGQTESTINYVKLKYIIKVFRELNIIQIEQNDEVTFTFRLTFSKNKTSLDKSVILKKLKAMYSAKR